MKKISDYMTRNAHTLGADRTLGDAKRKMQAESIRHLPILQGGQLIGVISERDLHLAFAIDGEKAKNMNVGDSCTTEAYTADASENLNVVAAEMAKRLIGCCVITERDKVVGIFTATDACRVLGEIA